MYLRMSTLFLRTLREDPADAEVPSHRLLVRAGYVRRIAPGIFSWLPLGYRVLRNVEAVVRANMDAAGFQEVHFPALLPREYYERTGRWDEYGETLFRLQDRRGADFLLGPTHEEMFTTMVKGEYSSYKDLPVSLYQIQTKYRDEARPRAGILRGREFIMKDSYSFDIDEAGLEVSYGKHRDAYQATFAQLGLDYVIVSAQAGAMGGSKSEEFLAPCEVGEDTFVSCLCGYAANVEAFITTATPADTEADQPAASVHETPDTASIDQLVAFSNNSATIVRSDRPWHAQDALKNVLFIATDANGNQQAIAIGLPGDREVDDKRLGAVMHPLELRPFTDDDFKNYPQLHKGYIGPEVLGSEKSAGITYLLDPRVVPGSSWISGANAIGKHSYGLVAGRDFTADGTVEAAEVRAGDACPNCGGPVSLERGIEIGHIFQLGRKYAQAIDLKVLDQQGKQVVVTMGSYGIGVSRAVAAIVEQHHDDAGIIWPRSVAPAHVHVIIAGKAAELVAAAEQLAEQLDAVGVSVLLDDRAAASVGVKFKDAELIGIPTIVVVGKGLAAGLVEVKDRRTGERNEMPVAEVVDYLRQLR